MAVVTAEVKKELLGLTKDDCTVPFLISKISKTTKISRNEAGERRGFNVKPPEWDLKAKLHLKAGEYINEKDEDTTLGRFLFNKLIIEGTIESIIPGRYLNQTVTSKSMGKIIGDISTALMEKRIQLMPNVTEFIQHFEFYGLMLCSAVSPSLTPGLLSVQEDVRAYRDKLYEEAEAKGEVTLNVAVEIEDKVIAFAAKKLANDPGMTLFKSGSRGSFEDSYKMMALTVGPVKNPATGKYDIIKSNYIDGIEKKDLPAMGNAMVNGAYPKAIGTADGGYITKQFNAVFQGIVLDEPGTDCGSKGYLPTFLTAKNYPNYMWQYAVAKSGKIVCMTSENKDLFLNKVINLRTPMGCLTPKLCNACAGDRFYKLGIRDVGLTAARLPNSIMNAGMKAFHVTKIHFHTVNPDDLLI